MNRKKLFLAFSLCAALAVAVAFAGQRGVPPSQGIVNFGKVSESLYRGAQPDAIAITNLSRLGIKTIINLRMPDDVWKPEEVLAQANGILYTNIPLHGLGRPTDKDVERILSIIENSQLPVFVHCQHGCDRTGTIIACYRIKREKWSVEDALKEARKYGMSTFERGMRHFVVDFGKPASNKSPAEKVP